MTDMGLFNKGQKERETFKVITRVDTVDPELKKKTLERMLELKKEQERKAAARRKAVRRGLAVAAIIALVIAVTPLRGYVASAAENVVNAIHSWMEDVFHVGMKKTDNGCTVEIIEARVANDFLYLTVDESFDDDLSLPYLYYYGSICDSKGNNADFAIKPNSVAIETDNLVTELRESDDYVSEYQIYVPELKNVINSYDKKYTCELHVCAYRTDDNFYYWMIDENLLYNNIKPCASIDLTFPIKKVDSVIQSESQKYDIDYSMTIDDIKFDFKKMYMDENNSNMVVEIIPLNGYKITAFSLDKISVYITHNWNENTYYSWNSDNIFFSCNINTAGSFSCPNFSCANGHYYVILNTYSYCNKLLMNLPTPYEFRITEIGYTDMNDDNNLINHKYYMNNDTIDKLEKTDISIQSLNNEKTETIKYNQLSISLKKLYNNPSYPCGGIFMDINLDSLPEHARYEIIDCDFEFELKNKNGENVIFLGTPIYDDLQRGQYIAFCNIPWIGDKPAFTFDELSDSDTLIIRKMYVSFDTCIPDESGEFWNWERKNFYLYDSECCTLKEIEKEVYVDIVEAPVSEKNNIFIVDN